MIEHNPLNFFSGLSGLVLPIPKYKFPLEHQNASRSAYYATIFNSIEINRSFYKIPLNKTISRWASSVSDDFKFTFKLFKGITHEKNLQFDNFLIEQFMEAISHVGAKKGCLLLQFPPSLKNDNLHQLERLLQSVRAIDSDENWTIAVEFRNKSWYNDDVYDMLGIYKSLLVIQDIPTSATPLVNQLYHGVYIRFHGPSGNYRGTYTDAFLMEYAGYVRAWLEEGKTVYLYFNNTMGNAFQNLATLKNLVLSS
jgi:uncharacterized protein YecE (DUF72 family)